MGADGNREVEAPGGKLTTCDAFAAGHWTMSDAQARLLRDGYSQHCPMHGPLPRQWRCWSEKTQRTGGEECPPPELRAEHLR